MLHPLHLRLYLLERCNDTGLSAARPPQPPTPPPPAGGAHQGPARRRPPRRTAAGWGIPGRRRPCPPARCWCRDSLHGTETRRVRNRNRDRPAPTPSLPPSWPPPCGGSTATDSSAMAQLAPPAMLRSPQQTLPGQRGQESHPHGQRGPDARASAETAATPLPAPVPCGASAAASSLRANHRGGGGALGRQFTASLVGCPRNTGEGGERYTVFSCINYPSIFKAPCF